MLLFIANNRILFFLHQHPKYEKESAYLFDKDMQKSIINHVITDMCMFLHVFNAQGKFFDKNDTLVVFSQLCLYERFGI
jgi:predicted transcriptional regulator